MSPKIQQHPLFVLLLPVFFVVHGVLENFGFVLFTDAATLCFTYLIATTVLTAIFYLIFRSLTKAALMTALCMVIYFLFGTIQDFLYKNIPIRFFSRYSFLLSVILITLAITFWRIRKTNSTLHHLTMYLNVLLAICLAVDITWIVIKTTNQEQEKLSIYSFEEKDNYRICDTCSRPDIYFFLFDEYASSASLKERFHFENDLDTFLLEKGFSIQTQSRSNYNFTPFSMASILNMNYLQGLKDINAVTAEDYARCNELVRYNRVIKFLDALGYEIVNYSIFDLAGHPSRVRQSFLPLKTKLITDRTLFSRINRDIGWLLSKYFPFSLFVNNDILQDRNNNNLFIDLTKQSAVEKRKRPAFIYTHLFMPHVPFYYDKEGKERSTELLYQEGQTKTSPEGYLNYVTYTNSRIKDMVITLQRENPSAVIIIMGDHGFRSMPIVAGSTHCFANFNAVYSPSKKINQMQPVVTGVNQFRVIFNDLFDQSFLLLKDSCIFLRDRKVKQEE